ncbi:bifunctional demethylmenaquinone methyltransferase/2-methoxy-6-polyprenyl-1,4-benzoquinol methylase UbiE [Desulfobotulus sp.]|jgi:demethylmenaquinone methyltransferase/2-methoxy-6-polyprenyl-1,4-benzoquinol methylase|uniref:bifunctional demethylmenaquinone methyltransferase/2-methoxy-6-polyprenyl-1,4-benzoquinol methylase UbiE n=1 Tax=Desulfobotulus sp. TaxID=1940337 RepID=UPI002A358AAE|nr:bifunctional demethylmenaquinone methyltransferase/2-methoxy-6-polyprenyl-1,4-benzoquinol methylase UbiE [Desulfobotulus sp.]MDY0163490.1 bifunctional demethylmenaquinone methyltransferase/2-methoxy-6-polyprenyl-1,4-benzoquinol methylase UbiE [Desulfobotulus sp.]
MKKKEIPFVQSMFDAIAPRYDFLNRLLSLRQDTLWRRKAVRALSLPRKGRVLDVACGTADVAMEVIRLHPEARVVGVDFSEGMLEIGREKVAAAGMTDSIELQAANALHLPFDAESFDAITIAFGIRNIQDREGALGEFFRCLRPGGRLAILELATPPEGFLRKLYLLYFQSLLPFIGGLFSSNFAYRYLPDSVLAFPQPEIFSEIIRNCGFQEVSHTALTLGVSTLYTGKKPL